MSGDIRRVFFLSNTIIPKKDAGGGSVIIYRHLIRLKQEGFKVTIVIFGTGMDYYDEFHHIFVPKKPWYPFLRKTTPLLTDIAMGIYYRALSSKVDLNPATDIALGVLCEVSNLVLVKIAEKTRVPYYLFYHDDNIFNRYWSHTALVKKQLNTILKKARHIFSVSEQMVEFLNGRNAHNTSVLYPIPDIYNGQPKQYNDDRSKSLNFCYAGLAMHIHFDIINRIGTAVKMEGGKFYCVTGAVDGFNSQSPDTIIIKDRFKTVDALRQFMLETIDVSVVFYSFDIQHEPRMESSFPSKFVEYAQLGIPVLLVAPPYSSLGKWAVKNNWLSYVGTDESVEIADMLAKLKEKEYWLACRQQVMEKISSEFNPEEIHKAFLKEITA